MADSGSLYGQTLGAPNVQSMSELYSNCKNLGFLKLGGILKIQYILGLYINTTSYAVSQLEKKKGLVQAMTWL